MKEYGYMIFQIKNIRDTDYSFMGWDYAKDWKSCLRFST